VRTLDIGSIISFPVYYRFTNLFPVKCPFLSFNFGRVWSGSKGGRLKAQEIADNGISITQDGIVTLECMKPGEYSIRVHAH